MKKKLLFIFLLALSSPFISAQCDATVLNFENNSSIPMYNITGDVDLTLNSDSTISLNLGANFMTAAGPDIRAFLVNSNNLTDQQLSSASISNLENIEFGLVGSNNISQNGAKSFTVALPTSSTIDNFDTVFFYCFNFNQFWDFGKFTSFSTANCALLSVEENSPLNAVSFHPNPAKDKLEISNDKQLDLSINIYNVLGEKVLNSTNVSLRNQTLNLTSLNSGVYLIQIKAEGKSITKKLVKQ